MDCISHFNVRGMHLKGNSIELTFSSRAASNVGYTRDAFIEMSQCTCQTHNIYQQNNKLTVIGVYRTAAAFMYICRLTHSARHSASLWTCHWTATMPTAIAKSAHKVHGVYNGTARGRLLACAMFANFNFHSSTISRGVNTDSTYFAEHREICIIKWMALRKMLAKA